MENDITKNEEKLEIKKVEVKGNPLIEQSNVKIFEVVEQLNKLSLVTPNEVSILDRAQTFLLSTYTDVPAHRTYIDKCVGVLTNARFPTPDAKFWQCKKEAEVQFYELMKEIFAYKRALVSLKELLYKREKAKESIEKGTDADHFLVSCDIDRLEISIAELNVNVKKIEKEIKFRIVEIGDWLSISKEWEPEMKHSKDIYSEHAVQSLFSFLESQIVESKNRNDQKAFDNFTDQLNTFKSLLTRKVKNINKS